MSNVSITVAMADDHQRDEIGRAAKVQGMSVLAYIQWLIDAHHPPIVLRDSEQPCKHPKYELMFRGKGYFDDADTITDIMQGLTRWITRFNQQRADGITLIGPVEDDYGFLVTDNAEVAKKWDMSRIER